MFATKTPATPQLLKNVALFQNIDDKTVNLFARLGQILTLTSKKGDDEFPFQKNIYLVIKGGVYISCIGQNGKKAIADKLEENDFFGAIGMSEEASQMNDCWFVEPLPKSTAVICEFDKEGFLHALADYPTLAVRVLSLLAKRTLRLGEKIEELTLYNTETRVLVELTKLGEQKGKTGDITVQSEVTHEKLAQSTGSVRETVSKVLAKLKRLGVIFYDKRKHIIIRLVNLRKRKLEIPIDTNL